MTYTWRILGWLDLKTLKTFLFSVYSFKNMNVNTHKIDHTMNRWDIQYVYLFDCLIKHIFFHAYKVISGSQSSIPGVWQMWKKTVTSSIACARSQQYKQDSFIWLAQMMCITTFCSFLSFVGQNVISDGLTHWLSIRKLRRYL